MEALINDLGRFYLVGRRLILIISDDVGCFRKQYDSHAGVPLGHRKTNIPKSGQ
ncbi:hypothetical protein HanPSC8_Chr15g0676901 [Helianthus annuus]|nr:hypothetical protein HanPSC8_Chr15g0676901 [Helianthus annuus]